MSKGAEVMFGEMYGTVVYIVRYIMKYDTIPYFMIFFCVGVMYSGEYDACDVTLSVYPHRASLKNMPDHGGNRSVVGSIPTVVRHIFQACPVWIYLTCIKIRVEAS
jgi:hypothetical protein